MQIDHNPNEPKIDRGNTVFWAMLAILSVLWFCTWYAYGLAWQQLGLGFITGGAFTVWATEKTGNKLPPWWR